MQDLTNSAPRAGAGLARNMPLPREWDRTPECALIPDESDKEDKIAVVYDSGDTPPTITVHHTATNVQTVWANDIAVAIVACKGGPLLTADDILLVERFVGRS